MNPYKPKKVLMPIKVYDKDYEKLMKKSGELTFIEGKRVSIAEIQRRILNIPNLDTILRQDSILNKSKRSNP